MIPEPVEFNADSLWQVTGILDNKIETFLDEYNKLSEEELLNRRYDRFRKF